MTGTAMASPTLSSDTSPEAERTARAPARTRDGRARPRPVLSIDLRKAQDGDTGIGTYVRQVVPRVCRAMDDISLRAVIQRGSRDAHAYLDGLPVEFVEIDARPFTPGEQWTLRRAVAGSDLFWATSLAHPLWPAVPMAMTVHDLAHLTLPAAFGGRGTRRWIARAHFESARRCARALLFTTPQVERQFHELLGPARGRTAVAPLGVDDAWFAAATATDAAAAIGSPTAGTHATGAARAPRFMVIGNLRPHKNFGCVVRAFDRVREALPAHRLQVVGPEASWQPGDAAEAAAFDRVRARVDFDGLLPASALRRSVASAEALVFASLHEGFGLPVLEAMAAGCAVAVARNGISDSLAGEAARSFDPRSVDDLASALVELAGESTARRSTRRAAGILRARSFSWQDTAGATAAVLRQALGTPVPVTAQQAPPR